MKRRFTKYPITSATEVQLSTSDTQMLLDLARDMLYETYQNYPEYDEEDAFESVLDHVIFVINNIDDGSTYSEEIKKVADYNNTQLRKLIQDYVDEHYGEYRWR